MTNTSKATRQQINDLLTKDRGGEGRGLQAMARVLERASEAAGIQGTGGEARSTMRGGQPQVIGTRREGTGQGQEPQGVATIGKEGLDTGSGSPTVPGDKIRFYPRSRIPSALASERQAVASQIARMSPR